MSQHTVKSGHSFTILASFGWVFFLAGLLTFSCAKEETTIQSDPPQSVKQLILDYQTNNPSCICHPVITQYIWKNKNIYVISYNDTLNTTYVCDWIPGYYNASGESIHMPTGYDYNDFLADATFVRVVWSC